MFRDFLFRDFFFLFLQLRCVEGWGGVLLLFGTVWAPPPRPAHAKIDLAQNVISAQAEKH